MSLLELQHHSINPFFPYSLVKIYLNVELNVILTEFNDKITIISSLKRGVLRRVWELGHFKFL